MTINSSILSLCVPHDKLPPVVSSFSDVSQLYTEDGPVSHSWSRGTIASQHLESLLVEFKAVGLYYMRETVAVMDQPQIVKAIAEAENLFAQIGLDPTRAASCTAYECSDHELIAASQLPEALSAAEVLCDDEGETLPYVVAYLKAHMVVLRHALRNDLLVLHGQSHHLDGSDA